MHIASMPISSGAASISIETLSGHVSLLDFFSSYVPPLSPLSEGVVLCEHLQTILWHIRPIWQGCLEFHQMFAFLVFDAACSVACYALKSYRETLGPLLTFVSLTLRYA